MKNKVQKYYEAAFNEAVSVVEKEARSILKRCKNLDEFVMAMGSYFFTDKDGEIIETHSSIYTPMGYRYDNAKPIFKKLNDFMSEWDDVLKISGEPMRFTKNSVKITDW